MLVSIKYATADVFAAELLDEMMDFRYQLPTIYWSKES